MPEETSNGALTDRLVRCFAAVFEGMSQEELQVATVESLEQWDSLASVTLLAVLEEEFEVTIDDLDLPGLTSFDAVHAYIGGRAA
jgi:acyl carrier protein